MSTPRVCCCVRGCRRSVRREYLLDERKEADGWGTITSYASERSYLCPLHRLHLVESGRLTESLSGEGK